MGRVSPAPLVTFSDREGWSSGWGAQTRAPAPWDSVSKRSLLKPAWAGGGGSRLLLP